MTQRRVFLSAVSSEFGQERRELRHDFGTRGMQVVIQEELSHLTGAMTLLHLLDTHMRDCTGAVFVIGDRSGAGFPTGVEADVFPGVLPPEMPRASYTQWEFFLARKHGTKLIVCRPRLGHTPNVPDDQLIEPDDAAMQVAFVRQNGSDRQRKGMGRLGAPIPQGRIETGGRWIPGASRTAEQTRPVRDRGTIHPEVGARSVLQCVSAGVFGGVGAG